MSSPEDKSLLNFIAATVENLRARIEEISEQMATKVDLANLREEMATKGELAELRLEMATKADLALLRSEVRDEIAALRGEMATKDDLALVATTVQGDFEQVHFRFDTLERVMATRFGQVETDISRIRSVLYLLVKDKPDMLRLLGQPTPGESRPQV
ncbi:MAG: hypothetical protein QOD33_753 [Pyrinomonadaceae bacterium]|jgi:hypothetical protein|nr:hypothetical protein [Pyrinomonadaceae bacterium]